MGTPTVSFEAARPSSAHTTIADRYRIVSLLGVGGMGSVYRALDLELDEPVALKVLRRDLVGAPGILERFRREVKLARKVTHPNVARTFDIGEHAGERFLTMELIDGESLGELLHRETRLSIERSIEIAVAVCQGLQAAHAVGVMHRDLKPDNVLLGHDRRIVITDFGIARACLPSAGPVRTSGLAIGTPDYMAPEQVEASADIDARADLYALGVMLYEMLVGERPFIGDSPFGVAAARLVRPPPDPREKVAIPDSLGRVILRCLERDPKRRYATALEVAAALSGLTLPAGLPAQKAPSIAPPPLAGALARKTAIAVRPLASDERVSTAGAFSGMTGVLELVSMQLARIPGVVVVTEGPHLVVSSQLVGGALELSVENAEDHIQLAYLRAVDPLRAPFELAAELASIVARRISTSAPALAAPPPRAEATALILRALGELKRTADAGATDRAIARLEQAIAIAPQDPWVNGTYALALARRFVTQETAVDDAEEAHVMATRALSTAPQMIDARVALALVDRERGDPAAAAARVRGALLLDASRRELHHLHGALLAEIDDGRAAQELSLAHDATHWNARWDEAVVRALRGEVAEADRLLASVSEGEEQSAGLWFTRARIALFTGELHRVHEVRAEVSARYFDRRDLLCCVLDAAARGRASADDLAHLRAHRDASLDVARRSVRYLVLEAELLAFVGDFHGAAAAIRAAAAAGLADLGWLDRAPILEPLRTRSIFLAARDQVAARAGAIRRALTEPQETLAGIE